MSAATDTSPAALAARFQVKRGREHSPGVYAHDVHTRHDGRRVATMLVERFSYDRARFAIYGLPGVPDDVPGFFYKRTEALAELARHRDGNRCGGVCQHARVCNTRGRCSPSWRPSDVGPRGGLTRAARARAK